MDVNDIVYKQFGNELRIGRITNISFNNGWKWVDVAWYFDDAYYNSQAWRKKLSGNKNDYYRTIYRVDEVSKLNVELTLQKLNAIKEHTI